MVMTGALVVPVAAMAALVVAAVMEAAAAAAYTVGAPDGLWDMQTDYAQWVKTKTFHPGDKITFTYSPELHDVVEVTEAGYGACSSANNISAFRTGYDVVALAAVGTRYFLCGLTGHCDSGMKIRVDVVAAGVRRRRRTALGQLAVGGGFGWDRRLGAAAARRRRAAALVATYSGLFATRRVVFILYYYYYYYYYFAVV